MATEIERKFLVRQDVWRARLAAGDSQDSARYRQGYLTTDKACTVRVRAIVHMTSGEQHGYITIKGKTVGASRLEYEYEIPIQDAEELLDRLCRRPLVEKIRYKVKGEPTITWEVDEFFGENAGLMIAEVELKDPNQPITKPDWVGQEVTDDPRYFNANLVEHPFSHW